MLYQISIPDDGNGEQVTSVHFFHVEIAKKYLIPKNRKAMGLKNEQIAFSQEAIREIINGYAREAGVRTLENDIKKILNKKTRDLINNLSVK